MNLTFRFKKTLTFWSALLALNSQHLAQSEASYCVSGFTGCTNDGGEVDIDATGEPMQHILHMVAPCYKEYAAVSGLIFAMLAQTDPRWTLTLVSDGPDQPMRNLVDALLAAHATATEATAAGAADTRMANDETRHVPPFTDQRIRLVHTTERHHDGGHSPRAAGLATLPSGDPGSWAVLSGGDNYYAPLFVESILSAIENNDKRATAPSTDTGSHCRPGLVYWDFVLDRKGNDVRIARLRERLAAVKPMEFADKVVDSTAKGGGGGSSEGAVRRSIPIAVGEDGETVPLSFTSGDDLFATALAFTQAYHLREGGGCELGGPDPEGLVASGHCVARLLVSVMEAEQATRPEGHHYSSYSPNEDLVSSSTVLQEADEMESYGILDRYEGFVSSELAQGHIDVGAFAFPTDLGKQVGYNWRHHSADWAFLDELMREVHRQNRTMRHIRRTLYVHN